MPGAAAGGGASERTPGGAPGRVLGPDEAFSVPGCLQEQEKSVPRQASDLPGDARDRSTENQRKNLTYLLIKTRQFSELVP